MSSSFSSTLSDPPLAIQTNIFKSAEAEIRELEHCIFSIHYKGCCEVDVPLLKTIKDAIESYTKEDRYALLITADPDVIFTRESRLYRPGINSRQIPWALVTNHLAHLLICRFFMRSQKCGTSFRMFRKKCEAIAWLRTQR